MALGELLPVHGESGRVHESCGDFAPGVFEVKGEYYFVGRSVARALDTPCAFKKCSGVSPTARCAVEDCDKRYHLACAIADGCRRVDDGFKLYCREHRSFAPKRARKSAAAATAAAIDDDDSNAVICFECGNGGVLICCDTCNRAVHQACAGLREIPEGDFSCAVCTKNDKPTPPKSGDPCPDDDDFGGEHSQWSDATVSPNRVTPPRHGDASNHKKTEFPTPSPFREDKSQGSLKYSTPTRPKPNEAVQKSVFLTPSPFRNRTRKVSLSQVKYHPAKSEFSTPLSFRTATQKSSPQRTQTKKVTEAAELSVPSRKRSVTQKNFGKKKSANTQIYEHPDDLTDSVFNLDLEVSQPPVTPPTPSDAESVEDEELDGMDDIFENDYTIPKSKLSHSLSQSLSQSTPVKQYQCFVCESEKLKDILIPCDTCDRVVHSKCAGEGSIPIGDFSCRMCSGDSEEVGTQAENAKRITEPNCDVATNSAVVGDSEEWRQVETEARSQKPVIELSSPSVQNSPELSTSQKSPPAMEVELVDTKFENKSARTPSTRSKKRSATAQSRTPRKKRTLRMTTKKRSSPESSPPPSKRRRSTSCKTLGTPRTPRTSSTFKWSKWSAGGTKRVSASQQPTAGGDSECTTPKWRPVLCSTGLSNAQKDILRAVASKKSTQIRPDFDGKVTHVIVNDSPTRTVKLCKAIAAGVPLVSFRWIEAAAEAGKDSAEWPSVEEYQQEISRKRSQKPPLFEGMTFFFGASEMKNDLASIVKLGSGNVLSRKPSAATRNIDGDTLYLVEDAGKKTSRRASLKPLLQTIANSKLIESKWILDRCMDSKQ